VSGLGTIDYGSAFNGNQLTDLTYITNFFDDMIEFVALSDLPDGLPIL
jgi:hypothetical protein